MKALSTWVAAERADFDLGVSLVAIVDVHVCEIGTTVAGDSSLTI